MTPDREQPRQQTKGERTASRILDVAEDLFAAQGYDGTSLRQIADGVGIKEPGLYNYFSGKQSLYEAVLHRGLSPMAEALSEHLERGNGLRDYTDLPAVMTDLLLEHPQMAALFQREYIFCWVIESPTMARRSPLRSSSGPGSGASTGACSSAGASGASRIRSISLSVNVLLASGPGSRDC